MVYRLLAVAVSDGANVFMLLDSFASPGD